MKRREFLKASVGAGGGMAAASGAASAAEDGGGDGGGGSERPDFDGWLEGIDGGFQDARGQDAVTVEVGAQGNGGTFAFAPANLWISPGTEVTFEWTSDTHNVQVESQPDDASWEGHETIENSGFSFSSTFETGGLYAYFCQPHRQNDMLGGIAVGDDVPTQTVDTGGGGGGGGEVDPHEMGVPFQPHYVGIATLLGMVVALVFTFFFLKYGTSPNTGYPEDR